jgi:predicted nucleic acid-binding protein
MSYLLDTNICSAHIRRPGGIAHRFIQHSGRLWMPTVVLATSRAYPTCGWRTGSYRELAKKTPRIEREAQRSRRCQV